MHFSVYKVKSVHGFIGVKTQDLVTLSFHRTPFRVVFSISKLCVWINLQFSVLLFDTSLFK